MKSVLEELLPPPPVATAMGHLWLLSQNEKKIRSRDSLEWRNLAVSSTAARNREIGKKKLDYRMLGSRIWGKLITS
jgi:hypothetical protein